MVEGAAFFLLCHDDVALDPDAVHKLVEESFRSNAGVVSPKFVNWDDPDILLHVGMSSDKTGAVVDRIVAGEVDHGQHDAVRDVFVAPGGCILVRADLFAELKGFDAGIVAMGEDLDLSWRCQVAGSRVVVAPEARVRHREAVAGGLEPLFVGAESVGRHPVTMQMLQRRHELRAVLKCYTRIHLVRVLPQAALLALGEVIVAVLARDRDRVRAVTGAWRWNARRLTELSVLRGELAQHRLFPDAEVRRLQVRGSARLSQYVSRLTHQGLTAANAVAASRERPERQDERAEVAVLTGSVGSAFSEDTDFDELDDLGRRAGRDRFGRRVRSAPLSTGRQRAVAVVIALLVDRRGDARPVLRHPAPGRPARPAAVVVDELAPLLLRAGSRPAWAPPHRPLPRSASPASPAPCSSAPWARCSGSSSSPASRWAPGASRGSCARSSRPGPASSRSSATSGSRCPTARWAPAAGTVSSPTRRSRSSCCGWPGPPAWPPTRSSPGPRWRQQPRRPDHHPRCRHRRGVRLRAGDRPARRRHGTGLGGRLGPRRRPGLGRARARGGRRGHRRGAAAHRALGGRDGAGRDGLRGDLRVADRGCDGPGLGRRAPLRHRPGGPLSHRVAPGRRRGTPPRDRAGGPAPLGGAAVGHGLRVVGPRVRHHAGRPGILRSFRIGRAGPGRAGRSRPASGSGSPPSRTTSPAASSGGARW